MLPLHRSILSDNDTRAKRNANLEFSEKDPRPPTLSSEDFCEECADIVFYNTVLHDFRDPAKVLRNAKTMLKLGGKLVNVDWKKKPTAFGPPLQIRFSEEQAVNLIRQAGFTIESVKDLERDFYIVTAKPQGVGKTSFHR